MPHLPTLAMPLHLPCSPAQASLPDFPSLPCLLPSPPTTLPCYSHAWTLLDMFSCTCMHLSLPPPLPAKTYLSHLQRQAVLQPCHHTLVYVSCLLHPPVCPIILPGHSHPSFSHLEHTCWDPTYILTIPHAWTWTSGLGPHLPTRCAYLSCHWLFSALPHTLPWVTVYHACTMHCSPCTLMPLVPGLPCCLPSFTP